MGRIFDSMAQLRGVSFEEFKISSRTFILDTLGEKETEKKQRFSIPVRILLTQNGERKANAANLCGTGSVNFARGCTFAIRVREASYTVTFASL